MHGTTIKVVHAVYLWRRTLYY